VRRWTSTLRRRHEAIWFLHAVPSRSACPVGDDAAASGSARVRLSDDHTPLPLHLLLPSNAHLLLPIHPTPTRTSIIMGSVFDRHPIIWPPAADPTRATATSRPDSQPRWPRPRRPREASPPLPPLSSSSISRPSSRSSSTSSPLPSSSSSTEASQARRPRMTTMPSSRRRASPVVGRRRCASHPLWEEDGSRSPGHPLM
jgi:hypothetical protein